jgi:hypothetical protein
VKLKVKVLNDENSPSIIPTNLGTLGAETLYASKGYVLELTVINTSDHSISFPLDKRSYSIPFSEDIAVYYGEDNVSSSPDSQYRLCAYGFVTQNGKFFDGDIQCSMPDIIEHPEEQKMVENRKKSIEEWGRRNHLSDHTVNINNWYIMNNMVTLKPKSSFQYKIYFNPFFKKICRSCYHEFYNGIDSKMPYEVNFKIILNQDVYHLMTSGQKATFKNLLTETVTSNTLHLQ